MAKDWEDAPSSDGWEDAPSGGLGTKALGVGEAALSTLSGIASAIPAGIRTLGEMAAGNDLDTAIQLSESSGKAATYEPRTDAGKRYAKVANDTLQDYQKEVEDKFSSDVQYLNQQKFNKNTLNARDLSAENTERTIGGLIGSLYAPGIPVPRKGAALEHPDLQKVLDREKELQSKPEVTPDGWETAPVQNELFDINNQGEGANPYEAQQGYWTMDENGIPIRADLSMEAQNMENPLQRNLWGDELPARENPIGQAAQLPMDRDIMGFPQMTRDPRTMMENDLGMTQALDQMPDAPWRTERDDAIDLLKGEIEAPGELESARMEANADSPAQGYVPQSQRGGINVDAFSLHPRLKDLFYKLIHETPLNRKEQIFVNQLQKEDYLGFDSPAQAIKALYEDGSKNYDTTPQLKAAATNLSYVPKKQLGGILFGDPVKQIEKVTGKTDMIPDDPDVKAGIEQSYGEADSKNWNLTESGAALTAIKRNSTIVRTGGQLIQNALKRAQLLERKNVTPVENKFKRLSKSELEGVGQVLKQEMLTKKRFSPEAIEALSVKQQEAYARFRGLMDDTLRAQNEARALDGKPPITEMEAYLSSRWDGDYRRPVYQTVLDKNGNPKVLPDGSLDRKLVWYLAAHTKNGLEKQTKALLDKHPDLFYDPAKDHTIRFYKRQTDLQSAMSTMIDVLGRDDPAVNKMMEVIAEQSKNEAATFLGQQKHFEEKSGVRGFVGDRPGREGKFSETTAMLNQQMQYAKNAYRWSEMQKIAPKMKAIFQDARLKQEQPNNIKYLREYWKNAMGRSEAVWVTAVNDAMRDGLGVNPNQIKDITNDIKGWFVMQKLMLSAGYSIMNAVQSLMILPHLVNEFHAGNRGNFLTAIPIGVSLGTATMASHYKNFWLGERGIPQDMRNFYSRAMKYAEDNGITTNSIYQHSPIENAFSGVRMAADAVGRTISAPEGLSRSVAFFTAVEYLRSTEKFTKDIELFQKAEELTNASIADHRTSERPMIFHKGGWIGNAFSTLQTWPINFWNQWKYFGTEAAKGNVGPFVTALAFQYAIAGAMGVPGFRDADKLYMFLKNHVLPTKWWEAAQSSDFWRDPKLWMVSKLGSPAVYGELSDATGIGMSTRLSAPAGGEVMQNPIGPFADVAKQIYHAGKAVYDPEKGFFDKDNVAQSLMASAPPGLQGLVENSPQLEGSTYDWRINNKTGQKERLAMMPGNIDRHNAVYARTPKEDTLRNWGLRSQKEAEEREVGYRIYEDTKSAADRSRNLPEAFYAAAKSGNVEAARDYFKAYVMLTGKPITNAQVEQQIKQNYMTSIERSSSAAKSVTAMTNVARVRKILDQIQKEQGE